jgi:hypothetical protein
MVAVWGEEGGTKLNSFSLKLDVVQDWVALAKNHFQDFTPKPREDSQAIRRGLAVGGGWVDKPSFALNGLF